MVRLPSSATLQAPQLSRSSQPGTGAKAAVSMFQL